MKGADTATSANQSAGELPQDRTGTDAELVRGDGARDAADTDPPAADRLVGHTASSKLSASRRPAVRRGGTLLDPGHAV
jgi:hypothetical protein